MGKRTPISLRRLLRFWILSYTALAVLLSGLLYLKYGHDEVDRRLKLAEGMIQLYSDDTVSIEFGRKNMVYVADAVRRLNALLNGYKARVRDPSGKIVESTDLSEIDSTAGSNDPRYRVLSAVIREHSSKEAIGTLEVFLDQRSLSVAAFRDAAIPALLLLSCLLLLSLLVIRSLQRRLIAPIKELLNTQPISKEDPESWPREIRDLSTRLKNALTERDLAMVGQLASGVIHDLRTLLHSTWSAASLASEQTPASERRLQRLEALLKATNANFPKMQTLIESTLDGAREIRVEAILNSIETTISQAVRVNEALAKRAGVVLQVQIGASMPLIAQDVAQLERALTNLIKNAIEAADAGSSRKVVRIRATPIDSGAVSIVIEDSGAGLGQDPKSVLTSLRSTKPHGTGFGLVISRKIVEAHRGRLVAGASRDLRGAMFEVVLPSTREGV